MRSPADSLSVLSKDRLSKRRKRGGLLMEETHRDVGVAEGRTGPQGSAPNMEQNRDIQAGSGNRRRQDMNSSGATVQRPQDTKTGVVGQEPNDRDTVGGRHPDRDTDGSMWPNSEAPKNIPMSDGEVQSAMHKLTWDAIEHIDQERSPRSALAAKYYQAEPFGNEEEGRSQVVMTDLRDTVLMILPSLMRMFFGPEYAVEYGPHSMQQVEMAEQATQFINEVVIRHDNRGALVFYEWFKDALIKRLGVIKYWYDDTEETKGFTCHWLSPQAAAILHSDPEITVTHMSLEEGAPPGEQLFYVEYTQIKKQGKLRFICIPPEEFIFTRGARTVADDHQQPGVALLVGHRTELTRSQLAELGVDDETIEEWAFKDVSLDHNVEEIQRQNIVKPDTSAIGPIATQKSLYIEAYPYMDVDGDGIAELRKIVMLGPSYHVISNEPASRRPFAVICPDPEPHTIIGQGISDYTMDLQKINSMVVRSMLDSLALSINPRMKYVDGEANLDDIVNPEIGAPIRVRSLDAVEEFAHRFVGGDALQVLEFLEGVKENRTGITKASAGLEAGQLQSSSRMAVAATLTSAQQHIEMIGRIFAETGCVQLFRGLLELLVENQMPARVLRVAGSYVEMDPRSWEVGLDVVVRVAIGAGLDDDKYQVLAEQATRMEQIFGTMGLQNPLVTMKQYRDTLVKMLKLKGRMDAEAFYQDVDPNWQPPQQPQPDPNMIIAQAEMAKAQAEVAKKQADMEIGQQKHDLETMRRGEDLKMKQYEIELHDMREKAKLAADIELKVQEMNLKYGAQLSVEQVKAQIEQYKVELNVDAKKAKKVRRHRIERDEKGNMTGIEVEESEG